MERYCEGLWGFSSSSRLRDTGTHHPHGRILDAFQFRLGCDVFDLEARVERLIPLGNFNEKVSVKLSRQP
jgi:hypothetical protein